MGNIISKNDTNSKRNKTIDYIKAFAIILVVVGHCIQYGSGEYIYNHFFSGMIIVTFIYSFHMPIFMLVSGYLFYYSLEKYSFKDIVFNKYKQLVLPLAFWSIGLSVYNAAINNREILSNPFKMAISWADWFIGARLWFLWAVFLCSVLLAFICKTFKHSSIQTIVVSLFIMLSLFTPDILCSQLYKFMFPFFFIGMIFNKYNGKKILKEKRGLMLFAVCFVIYIATLVFFKDNYFIYNSGYTLIGKQSMLEMMYIDSFRFVSGLTGSFSFIFLISIVLDKVTGIIDKVILYLGKNTMGIYIISSLLCEYLLFVITKNLKGVNCLILLAETVVSIAIALLIMYFMRKWKWSKRLLLGEWK